MASAMTISRAADRAGVGVETIRFYERRGLIEQPLRPHDGGYRLYDDDTIERIRFIRQAQELGFSLREIAELLALKTDPDADCFDVRMQVVAKRREVERKIGQLQAIRSALDLLIARCPGDGALGACTIMDALEGHHTADAVPSPEGSPGKAPEMVQTVSFGIEGMHCEGCARTVEALLRVEEGVVKASVSFERREADIRFNSKEVSPDRLKQAVSRAGYRLVEHR